MGGAWQVVVFAAAPLPIPGPTQFVGPGPARKTDSTYQNGARNKEVSSWTDDIANLPYTKSKARCCYVEAEARAVWYARMCAVISSKHHSNDSFIHSFAHEG